ncbi:uncharacterized protein LOC131018871 [Salvia miltiorrhiza]|uniref:uncharacterized protein LOC131018871 n=1 Tax=Salvia miltiorrhiza TaxID=226208 RepID=UPI0025ACC3C2|nr:uncharacterized protein LOC131018871 [Salvia miltiorrhiza]
MGDFNVVKGAYERLSVAAPNWTFCAKFCLIIDETNFIESPTNGLVSLGRVEDFCQGFADLWSSVVTSILPRLTSDHSPLVLQCKLSSPALGRRPFQFLNMWTLHPTFTEMVFNSWSGTVSSACPILKVMLKLKRLRSDMGSWNKEVFDEDRNTSFFHSLTKFKKKNSIITRLNIDGEEVYDPSTIETHIVDHFSSLFTDDGSPLADQLEIDAYVDHNISDDQNNILIRIPDDGEIAATIFDMDTNSAPGPDGYSGMSYLPVGCNSSTMILISKKEVMHTVVDLRPIVLSNFFFKIISKILASRLSVVASTHVSANQFGFISGRNIHDCIMLSSEGFNYMERTNRGKNMACKIDIRIAFDTIRWDFIIQDVLSSLFNTCVSSRHLDFPTHLLYADDIIVFCKATVRNARKIQDILAYYGSISGQCCNQEKFNVFFASKVPLDQKWRIQRILEFSIGRLPMKYLGVPIFVGWPRASYFMSIHDRIMQKFTRWKGIQLSLAGRLCLVSGEQTYFWKDDWLGYKLVDKLKIPHYIHGILSFSVKDYFYDGLWHFSTSFVNKFPEIVAEILFIPMSGRRDTRYWNNSVRGDVTDALAFASNCGQFPIGK